MKKIPVTVTVLAVALYLSGCVGGPATDGVRPIAGTAGDEPYEVAGVRIQPLSGFEEHEAMWVGYDNIEPIIREPGEEGPEGYYNLGAVHPPYEGHWYRYAAGHEFSDARVHAGQRSLRWFSTPDTSRIVTDAIPHDWSEYGFLSFWAYSEVANYAGIEFVLYSEDLNSPRDDYYNKEIVVDWEGWRFIEIAFDAFTPTRSPVGWHQIDYIKIASTGWGHTAMADTVLHLDDLNITTDSIAPDPLADLTIEFPDVSHPFLFGDEELYRAAMEKSQRLPWAERAFASLHGSAVAVRDERPVVPATGGGFYHDESDPAAYAITAEHYRLSRGAAYNGIVYRMTGDESFGEAAKDILLQYAEIYLDYELHDKFGNTGEAATTGGRATSQSINEAKWIIPLAHAYDTTYDLFSRRERDLIELRLFRPAAELIMVNNEGKHNHQAWYNAGVGVIGFLLRDEDYVKYALHGPDNGFFFQMRASITPDGMWYEGSGHYQFYTMDPLVSLSEAAAFSGIDLYENEAFQSYFRFPGLYANRAGKLPVINDGRRVDITLDERSRFLEIAYHRLGDPALVAALRSSPRSTWQALLYDAEELPDGGGDGIGSVLLGGSLAVLRSGDLFATLNGRPYSGGHSHYDKLSITLHDGGEILAPDSGSIKYRNPAQNAYFKSTSAHNTLVRNYEFQRYVDASQTTIFTAGPRYQAVRMVEDEAYADTEMSRTLVMGTWYMLDVTTSESSEPGDLLWVYRNDGRLATDVTLAPTELPQTGGFEYWAEPRGGVLGGDASFGYEMAGGRYAAIHYIADGNRTEFITARVPIAAERGDEIAPDPYQAVALKKSASGAAYPILYVPTEPAEGYRTNTLFADRTGAALRLERGSETELVASFYGPPEDRRLDGWETDASALAVRTVNGELRDVFVSGASYLRGGGLDVTFGSGLAGLRRPGSLFHFVVADRAVEVVNGGAARMQVSLSGLEGRTVTVGGVPQTLRPNDRTGRSDIIINPAQR